MVALIVLECILAAFLPPRAEQSNITHLSGKSFSAVFWTSFIGGTEEEKIEELSDKSFAHQIADLKENIYFLSRIHATPRQPLIFNYNHGAYSSSFLALLCTLII